MRRGAAVWCILVLLFSLAATGVASAEPPGMTSPAPVRKDPPPGRKSPAVALGLGLGLTAAGALAIAVHASDGPEMAPLGVVAMYIGPSIGRWYAGGSAAVGLTGRTAGAAVMVSAVLRAQEHPEDDAAEEKVFYAGLAIWMAATAYDLVMAPLDARDFNREHAVTVAPTVMQGGGQGAALVPGLALSGRF